MASDRKYLKKVVDELKHNRSVMGNIAEKIMVLSDNYGILQKLVMGIFGFMIITFLYCLVF